MNLIEDLEEPVKASMKIKNYIKLIRVTQWSKNVFLFVPLVFAKKLFEIPTFEIAFLAFLQFCLVSSTVYIFNDIIDVKQDREHPTKRFRPIASGSVKINSAIALLTIFFASLIPGLFVFNYKFNLLFIAYLILNTAYTLKLKNVVILDILSLASGFVIRVLAGAYVINVPVSNWLILSTLFVSIFLALIKRRSELAFNLEVEKTRKVLKNYTITYLDQLTTISATGLIVSYALYAVSQSTIQNFHTENLIFTIIFVVYGIFRYMYLMHVKKFGENPIDTIFKDFGMILNIFLYIGSIILIIYFK
ncbi:MAG TPA: decaprenyl-phosphate phosphoribosyltransferase [Melioribacteraceae bacterium]|nr:decaprenyl-phosphate phosphoribosyltransferase [Melioribacteraceae bacterium]